MSGSPLYLTTCSSDEPESSRTSFRFCSTLRCERNARRSIPESGLKDKRDTDGGPFDFACRCLTGAKDQA